MRKQSDADEPAAVGREQPDGRPSDVLILSADAGFGHKAAANAIAAALPPSATATAAGSTIVNPLDHTERPGPARQRAGRLRPDDPAVARPVPGGLRGVGRRDPGRHRRAGADAHALHACCATSWARTSRTSSSRPTRCTRRRWPRSSRCRAASTPFLTVVTDLATVHRLWFNESAEMCLVPTPAVAREGPGERPAAPNGSRSRGCR